MTEAIRYIQAPVGTCAGAAGLYLFPSSSPTLCGYAAGVGCPRLRKGVALSFDLLPVGSTGRCPSLIESELISIIGNLLDND